MFTLLRKLFKCAFILSLGALAGLVAIQFEGPRNFVKDLGFDL